MNLDISNWKPFKVSELFLIYNGKGITEEEIAENPGDFVAVQSGEENNGVMGLISLDYCKSKNYTVSEKPCLTVARSGSAGFVSFQVNGCVVGDSAKILQLKKEDATVEHYIFLQTILNAIRYKYAYGRKVTETKYKNEIVRLPIIDTKDGYVPDWQFMEDYIKSLHHKTLTTQNKAGNTPSLNVQDWKEYKISDLFEVKLSKGDIKADEVSEGDVILLSSGETNNGVVKHIDSMGDGKAEIFEGNKITVDMFCNAFYQENSFYAVSHGRINILIPKFALNKYIGLFIATIIKNEQFKYSYGRAVYSNVLENMIIKLPTDSSAKPNWQFMENYIKSLPYSDRLEG